MFCNAREAMIDATIRNGVGTVDFVMMDEIRSVRAVVASRFKVSGGG